MKAISVFVALAAAACGAIVVVSTLPISARADIAALSASPAKPRFHQTAQLLPDGKVLLAGGMPANGAVEASAELYDPVARRFSSLPEMRRPRVGAASAVLPDGDVLIAGGSDGHACLASAEIYVFGRRVFRPAMDMHAPRCGAQAFVLKDGRVLLAGGSTSSDDGQQSEAEIYDPRTGTFARTGSMHVPRSSFAGAVLRDGKVLVMGGWSAGTYPGRTIEKSAELYDPTTGRFSTTGSMTAQRYKMAAVRLDDGRVLVIGGSDARDWHGISDTTEIYDPRTGLFSAAARMHFKRFKLPDGATLLGGGRVLVTGGAERAEIYDPARDVFAGVSGPALDGFYFSTATRLAGNDVLIVGGYGEDPGAGAVDRAWLYHP